MKADYLNPDTSLYLGILAPDLDPRHGWGAYSLGLLRAFQRRGVALTIITARNSPFVDDIKMLPLLPTITPPDSAFLPRLALAAPAVRAALRGCDVIHALAEPYAPLAAWIAGARPLFISGHGTYVRLPVQPFPRGALYRWAFQRGRLICVSRYTDSIARGVLPDVQTVVINNGIEAADLLLLARTPDATPVILSVGAVKARKGMLELVQALAIVREHVPDARLIIVGALDIEPEYVVQVRAEIARLGIGEVVELRGRVPDEELRGLYRTAHLFALPALNAGDSFEGYGLALLEASATGLPVVSTLGSGTEDAVDDGVTGLLALQGDAQALASALLQLLRDPLLAARMGAAGRLKAAAQTWDAVAARYLEVYREHQLQR
ncbi:MAG: glycosyltransferase family 4 protein [Chloroflexota bacterium]|nr:glycosyltransferase family 4 protein [Chloroflexota bacterium]